MTTAAVIFAGSYLNIESHYESLQACACKEWFDLVYSYKIRQRHMITDVTE